jgi:hypothetical protein
VRPLLPRLIYYLNLILLLLSTERFINGSLQGFPWGGKEKIEALSPISLEGSLEKQSSHSKLLVALNRSQRLPQEEGKADIYSLSDPRAGERVSL